jgi:molybdopterin-containing oxidoreductase family iron-sulfur binding subunit
MVRKSSEETRSYQVLEEVGMKPNVWYKTKVRNEKNAVLESIQIEKKEIAHSGEGHGKKAHH